MYNVIHQKPVIVLVVIAGLVGAWSSVPAISFLSSVCIYAYMGILMVTAIARYGIGSTHVQAFLIDKMFQLGVMSLMLVPAINLSWEKLTKYDGMSQAQLRADSTNATVAPTLCPVYFRDGFPQSYVANWNLRFCEAFPEYDSTAKVAAVTVDNEASGSTTTKGLWK
ncbi:hypothetical protein E0J20_09120 [Rhizobium leguminosarum bv. viciae]|nr:hypothetical protein E0J20_09120 [Rhizobium leguminosarum bv. viciae]